MAAKFELPFTQPSTIVAFLCTLVIVIFVSPLGDIGRTDMLNSTVRLFHLFSFATWLGVQVWVTFFAGVLLSSIQYVLYCIPSTGITMYKNLPRHMFGLIQSKLFPKYFLLGTILSSVTLVTYIIEHPLTTWAFTEKMQVSSPECMVNIISMCGSN